MAVAGRSENRTVLGGTSLLLRLTVWRDRHTHTHTHTASSETCRDCAHTFPHSDKNSFKFSTFCVSD